MSGTIKHGMTETPLYGTWCNIKRRCFCEHDKHYPRWGGRGIKLYAPWVNDFTSFYDYVSKLEHFGEKGYTLDRINNDGDYEPNNLRWATVTTQNRNKRTTHRWEYQGKNLTLQEWSERTGLPRGIIKDRLFKLGWGFERAINTPVLSRSQWSNRKIVHTRIDVVEKYRNSKQSS